MFADFLETCQGRYGVGDSNTSTADWITNNTTLKKRPFSFARYPFQRAIADDMHPSLTVEKCSQVGLTEIQIRKFFAMLARGTSLNGIFTLPNEKMYKRIYSGRMAPILTTDKIFNPVMANTPVRRNDLVQIRDSFGYITGCTEGDATSISADFLFHDELDLSPSEIIGLFPSRLQGSDLGITQSFSTPSFLDFGINRAFMASDQHEYLCKCHSCNHWNLPKFEMGFVTIPGLPDDLREITDLSIEQIGELDLQEAFVRCERCSKPLDLGGDSNREWVPARPGRVNNRGYKVRPFSTGRLSVAHILGRLSKARQDENLRGFHNTVLGNPFTASNAQIQRADIEACMTLTGNVPDIGMRPAFMGIDIGQICHIVITTNAIKKQFGFDFVFYDTCHISQLRERISELLKTYNIIQGCADRFPYTPNVDALRDDTSGLILPVQYRGTAVLGRVRDELGNVTHYSANRTTALDRVKTIIEEKSTVISGYGPHRETLITHLGNMVRDDQAEEEPEWKKMHGSSTADHFFHASALALIAPRINEDYINAQPAQVGSLIMVQSASWIQHGSALTPQSAARGNKGFLI